MMKLFAVALLFSACILSVSSQYTAAQLKANDILVLNYALTLENLEASFYNHFQAIYKAANFTAAGYPSGTYEYFNLIQSHENAHVASLSATVSSLGGTPVTPCATYNFNSVTSVQTYVGLAQVLESTGVTAYDGAVQYINDKGILTAAATIATVEARHAAFLSNLTAMNPFPGVFDNATMPSTIANIVAQFLGTGCPTLTLPSIYVQLPSFSSVYFSNNGTLFAANGSTVATQLTANDVNVFQFALFLEQLEAHFYNQFLAAYPTAASFGSYGAGVFTYVALIKDHENAHVAYLNTTLTSLGVAVPVACNFNFSVDGPLNSVSAYLALARAFEGVGVTAYDGAIAAITTKAYAEAAATIATVEARHASYLNLITGQSPFPANTDTAVLPATIVSTVAKYLLQPCSAPVLPNFFVVAPFNVTSTGTTTTGTTTSVPTSSTGTGATGTTTSGSSTGTSTAAAASSTSTASATTSTSSTAAGTSASTTSAGVAVVASSAVLLLASIFALLI